MKRGLCKKYAILMVMLAVVLALALPVLASETAPPLYLRLSNDYIQFDWGIGNTVDFTIGDTPYSWDVAGRWALRSITGDPETQDDDGEDLIPRARDWAIDSNGVITYDHGYAPCHKFAYIKVKVGDNSPSVIGVSGGGWTQGPAYFAPPDGLGLGKNGRFIEGEWTTAENVAVLMKIYLVRDQVRFEYKITNNAAVSQSVGLQMQGAARNVLQNSGFLTGPVFVPGFGNLEYGKVFTGSTVPDSIEKMNSIPIPTVVARNLLSGQDAVKPSRIALGNQDHLVGYVGWDSGSAIEGSELEMWLEPRTGYPTGSYNPDVRVKETNMGWAMCWDRKILAPAASRTIVNYYGIGVTDGAWTVRSTNGSRYDFDSAGLSIQSIRALKYDTTDPVRVSDFSPDTFDITAYVNNLATDNGVYDLGDVNVSLLLPDGLQLDSGSAVQSFGYITKDTEAGPAKWTVRADGSVSGSLEYFVRAQDTVSGWNQIVSRKILVPAIGSGTLRAGWQLLSVPFTFTDSTPNTVFGKLTGQIFPQYWNLASGSTGSYRTLTSVKPGQGFWAYATGGGVGQFTVPVDKKIYGEMDGVQGSSISIDLKPGWNLVGTPYVFPVYWGQAQFYNKTDNLALPLAKAVSSGWLNSTYFSWNAAKSKYDYFSDPQGLLEPWKGYWIRAKKNVTMILTPLQWPASDVAVLPGG